MHFVQVVNSLNFGSVRVQIARVAVTRHSHLVWTSRSSPSPQVSYEDVDRLKEVAQVEKVRIPHFMQDQARYAEELSKIMAVNQLTDTELKSII